MRLPHTRRAIFLDLDGTIMTEGGEIPLSARHALARARSAGHALVLSTGRSAAQLPPAVADLAFDAVITGSGWRIELADGSRLHDAQFDPAVVGALSDALRAEGTLHYFESHRGLVVSEEVRMALRIMFGEVLDPTAQEHWEHFFAHGLAPDTVGIPPEATKIVCLAGTEWAPVMPEGVRSMPTSIPQLADRLTELMPTGVHKGAAMDTTLEWLGLPRAASVAVGDGENDVEMLTMAGVGVAMGSANAAVRAAADWVAPPAERDGLWMALRHARVLGAS